MFFSPVSKQVKFATFLALSFCLELAKAQQQTEYQPTETGAPKLPNTTPAPVTQTGGTGITGFSHAPVTETGAPKVTSDTPTPVTETGAPKATSPLIEPSSNSDAKIATVALVAFFTLVLLAFGLRQLMKSKANTDEAKQPLLPLHR